MEHESQLNEVQAVIMRQLFTRGALRFSQVNARGFPSDQFSYHLRQLTKQGLIEKLADNRYQLSTSGRSRAILLDTHASKFIQQGFVACRIILAQVQNGLTHYLMQKRTKVPYRGYIADPGGKILFGEDVLQAAKRNMLVETGLDCTMTVQGLAHFKDSYQGRIVQDKFFFVIKATRPIGTLLAHGPTGENLWLTAAAIQTSAKVHQGLTDLIAIAQGRSFGFTESTHITEEY